MISDLGGELCKKYVSSPLHYQQQNQQPTGFCNFLHYGAVGTQFIKGGDNRGQPCFPATPDAMRVCWAVEVV